ncbi:MAG: chemotaxis protein CheA [Planctomycetaceae bacterium]|nr:chemotaxis protein CheA [Planctomycetaceae bacterium]
MISEELLQSFIAEASDLLDDVEPSLVEYSRLDDVDERTEIVNRVFRHFHSIKGSAGFVGLHDIARLTHEAETLLEQFRKAPEKIIPQTDITLLCRTVDLLRAIFHSGGDSVDADGNELGIDELIAEIVAATQAAKGLPPKPLAPPPVSDVTETPPLPPAGRESAVETDELNAGYSGSAKGESEEKTGPDATQTLSREAVSQIVGATAPKQPPPPTPRKPTRSVGTKRDSMTRSRRTSSDTARIINTSQMAKQEKMGANEFAGRYVTEANELLEQIEQSLLQAEQHPESSAESIQEALRSLHSFKGNSGFMNLIDLERLSHRMESEVEHTIDRTLGLDSQTFDSLLQMIDVLRQGVLDFSCGGTGAIPEADAYIAMLDEFSAARPNTSASTRPATTVLPAPAPKPEPAATNAAPPPAEKKPEEMPAEPAQPAASTRRVTRVISKKERDTATRRISKPKGTDTTKLVLRGSTSTQEDLRALPKADHLVIRSDTEVAPPVQPAKEPAKDTTKKIKDTDHQTRAGDPKQGKNSDTGQKRRSAEQLTARNDIRVDLRKLDAMLDLVGELVIAEAMVTRHPVVWNADNESLERAVHQLRRVASSLQDMATSVRMIPLAPTFRRMTRLVYDLSVKAGKLVDLILLGEDTEVDRTVIERISDPLVHIIRNAIDHGIESPDERLRVGKPETGRLTIEGHHEGGEVWIVITDDGRGLDREAILNRAISRGLVQGDGSDLTDNQIYHFVFESGFSTANKVTDISGRGFGMDVVKKNIEKLSGRIDIRTRPGEGTAVVLRIPLTLAIIDGMLVSSGDTRYIIPLLSIRESLRPEMSQIMSTPDGQQMVKLRDELIPIVKLDETFSRVKSSRGLTDGILMIVEGEDGDVVALFADELLGQQETVIKGLSGWLKKSRGVSGCTILGDGEVGLILDIGAIVRLARERSAALGA